MLFIKILALGVALLAGWNTLTLDGMKRLSDSAMTFLYDDSYIRNKLDHKFPYLKLNNGSYIGPREYFKFEKVFQPDREYYESTNVEQVILKEQEASQISQSIATTDQWHYSDENELLSSSWPPADESKCLNDLSYIENELFLNNNIENFDHLFNDGFKNIQLLRLMDSWARPVSETYFGNSHWPGSYRGCLSIELPVYRNLSSIVNLIRANDVEELRNNNQIMKFRYCWAKLRAKNWPEVDEIVPPASFKSGICLPNTCDTRIANQHKQRILQLIKFNFSPMHRQRFNQIIDVYCLPTSSGLINQLEQSGENYNPNETSSKIVKFFLKSWIVALVATSTVAALNGYQFLPGILKQLTLQEIWKQFTSDDEPPTTSETNKRGIDFRTLGHLRLLASVSIVVGHVMMTFGYTYNSTSFHNPFGIEPLYHTLTSIFKLVDLFMLISGMLTSLTVMKKIPQNKIDKLLNPKVYLFSIISKYLRWWPMFMLIVAFNKAIYISIAKGPFWDYGTDKYSLQFACKQSSWWRILAFPIVFDYRAEGNNRANECVPVSWHLIADLRLSLFTPIIMYLMLRDGSRLKVPVTILAVLISTFWQYMHFSMQRLFYFQQFYTYGFGQGINMLSIAFDEPNYSSSINRLHGYAIGLLAGIYIYQYQEKKNEQNKKMKKPFWMSNWLLFLAIIWNVYDVIARFLVAYFYYHRRQVPDEDTLKWSLTLNPRVDSLSFAIIAMRLVTDLAPSIMKNTKLLYKIGKLSYCVFLVHPSILAYAVSAHETNRIDTHRLDYYNLLTFSLCCSFLISFPLYLLFEVPFSILTRWLLGLVSSSAQQSGRAKSVKSHACTNELSSSSSLKRPLIVMTRANEKKQTKRNE